MYKIFFNLDTMKKNVLKLILNNKAFLEQTVVLIIHARRKLHGNIYFIIECLKTLISH